MTTSATTLLGVLRGDGGTYGVRFEREYATTAADLWAAITEPGRVARWMAPVEGEARVGGEVVVRFPDGDTTLRVVRCEPPRTLAVAWVHPRPGTAPSLVTVEVTPIGDDASRLVLEHTELTRVGAPGHAAGWQHYLAVLAGDLGGEPVAASFDEAFEDLFTRYREAMPPS